MASDSPDRRVSCSRIDELDKRGDLSRVTRFTRDDRKGAAALIQRDRKVSDKGCEG